VFENEAVKWLEPNASDNVGIASKYCTSLKNGTLFPVGNHRITCYTHDFDDNMASCNFRVSVTGKGKCYILKDFLLAQNAIVFT
jgi:hypothetical protein